MRVRQQLCLIMLEDINGLLGYLSLLLSVMRQFGVCRLRRSRFISCHTEISVGYVQVRL